MRIHIYQLTSNRNKSNRLGIDKCCYQQDSICTGANETVAAVSTVTQTGEASLRIRTRCQ